MGKCEQFNCPWMDAKDLRRIADEARDTYWPENSIPIEMEEIIDLRLRLNIEFIQDLFSEFNMIAYLKSDLSGVVVDYNYFMKENKSNPLRFALAHELGHYVLHRELYTKISFNSPKEWQDFIITLPESEYSSFECQANEFAGRFLVPREMLKAKIDESMEEIKRFNLIGYLKKYPDIVLSRISPPIRRYFGVSEDVIEKRIHREKLWPPKLR